MSTWYFAEPAVLLFTAMASRRLTRLKLKMASDGTQGDVDSAMQAIALAPARATLTHLYFSFAHMHLGNLQEAEHVQTLDSNARAMPNLEILRYSGVIQSLSESDLDPLGFPRESFPRALSAFKDLKMMAFDVMEEDLSRRPICSYHCQTVRGVVSNAAMYCNYRRYTTFTWQRDTTAYFIHQNFRARIRNSSQWFPGTGGIGLEGHLMGTWRRIAQAR